MFTVRQFISITLLGSTLISGVIYAQNAAIVNGKAIPKAQLDKLVQQSKQGDSQQVRDQARALPSPPFRHSIHREDLKR